MPAAEVRIVETERPARDLPIDSVVVTGTRYAADIRHLPMSVSVVGRPAIEQRHEASLLPLLTEQVPGLFVTARGVMGYGVSTGAAGGMSLRGIGGGSAAQMLVLIDGHPQYMGLFGHPIADAAQSMLAERVEVVRGPASVLYGSNAMGGVINIVTRQQREEGVRTDLDVSYGSWNTLQAEAANRIRKGRFSSVVTASYNRTDGHRADMGFGQYGGYAKIGYAISRHWNASADVNVTHFNASNPGPVTGRIYDNDSRITRGMTSVALTNEYDRTSGALTFFYNWGRHRINDGYKTGEEPLDYRFHSRDRMLGVSLHQSTTLWQGARLTAGIDWQHFGGEAWNRAVADGSDTPIVDRTEDEEVLRRVAAELGDELCESESIGATPAWGVVTGREGVFRTFRFFPHRVEGEGMFLAVARRAGEAGRVRDPRVRRSVLSPVDSRTARELSRWVADADAMRFMAAGDTLYGCYADRYDDVAVLAGTLAVIYSGVAMGQVFKGALRPDGALALFAGVSRDAVPCREVSQEEALRFLRKQDMDASGFEQGLNMVTRGGLPLGFVKRVGARVNNMYSNSLRILK